MRWCIVVNLDASFFQDATQLFQRSTGDTDGHTRNQRTSVVEGRHCAGEGLLNINVRGTQQVLLRNADVVQAEHCGIRGTNTQLFLQALHGEARGALLHQEGLDGSAALGLVQGRPHNDGVGALTSGDEDLLTVDDVLITIELGSGGNCGGVRTEGRLGNCHGSPGLTESLQLLISSNSCDSCVTQTLVRQGQGQTHVTPAGLNNVEQRSHVATVFYTGTLLFLVIATSAGSTGEATATICHAVHHGGKGVEFLRVLVLSEIVLTGNRSEDLSGGLMRLGRARLEELRQFEVNHFLSS